MKNVLIIENSTSSLIKENVGSKKNYVMGGTFTEFGILNRNDRVYTAEKFIPALNELKQRIVDLGPVVGEYDHPDSFDLKLEKASHLITELNHVEEKNAVEGKIKLLSTMWGREAKALVDDEAPIFLSSRAAGITEANNIVAIKKLFTYDMVADPGFASARMNSLNESLGFKNESANFRIYELSESHVNELFNMNNNDVVTKNQLEEYSSYLIKEMAEMRREIAKMKNKDNAKNIEYLESLEETQSKIINHLDYLAEQIETVSNENEKLNSKTDRIIEHNDYLAEQLEKECDYTEYLTEQLDKSISYSEYIAENLEKNIAYSDYLAENIDMSITHGDYLAEQLEKSIDYSEYIAEKLDKSIDYSEYIVEHVEGSINHGDYLAEQLEKGIDYSKYLAETLDKSMVYQQMISEKINSGLINESNSEVLPSFEKFINDDECEEDCIETEEVTEDTEEVIESTNEYEELVVDGEETEEVETTENDVKNEETEEEVEETYNGEDDKSLSESIDALIEKVKERKAIEKTENNNFMTFLTKSQIEAFQSMSIEDQDTARAYISERNYYSQNDVISLISESLSAKEESLESKLLRLIPESVKPSWEAISESAKKSILSQAKLYPSDVLSNDESIEHFWLTRNIKINEASTRTLLSKDELIMEDKLDDTQFNAIMERIQRLK